MPTAPSTIWNAEAGSWIGLTDPEIAGGRFDPSCLLCPDTPNSPAMAVHPYDWAQLLSGLAQLGLAVTPPRLDGLRFQLHGRNFPGLEFEALIPDALDDDGDPFGAIPEGSLAGRFAKAVLEATLPTARFVPGPLGAATSRRPSDTLFALRTQKGPLVRRGTLSAHTLIALRRWVLRSPFAAMLPETGLPQMGEPAA